MVNGRHLLYIPDNKQLDTQKITDGNIHHLLPGATVYIFQLGCPWHLQCGERFYRLDTAGKAFHPRKVMAFDDSPCALEVTEDSLFIAAHSCFFVLTPAGITKLFPDAFWDGLYPNSVAVKKAPVRYISVCVVALPKSICKNNR